jgi:hypothetical protein
VLYQNKKRGKILKSAEIGKITRVSYTVYYLYTVLVPGMLEFFSWHLTYQVYLLQVLHSGMGEQPARNSFQADWELKNTGRISK